MRHRFFLFQRFFIPPWQSSSVFPKQRCGQGKQFPHPLSLCLILKHEPLAEYYVWTWFTSHTCRRSSQHLLTRSRRRCSHFYSFWPLQKLYPPFLFSVIGLGWDDSKKLTNTFELEDYKVTLRLRLTRPFPREDSVATRQRNNFLELALLSRDSSSQTVAVPCDFLNSHYNFFSQQYSKVTPKRKKKNQFFLFSFFTEQSVFTEFATKNNLSLSKLMDWTLFQMSCTSIPWRYGWFLRPSSHGRPSRTISKFKI